MMWGRVLGQVEEYALRVGFARRLALQIGDASVHIL
jgi:hypothetical protein